MDLPELLELAEKERRSRHPLRVRCCVAAGCVSANSEAVLARLQEAVREAGLEDRVRVSPVGCLRLCCEGPLVRTDPDGALYQKVTPETASSIVAGLNGGGWRVGEAELVKARIEGGPLAAAQAAARLLRITFTLPDEGPGA